MLKICHKNTKYLSNIHYFTLFGQGFLSTKTIKFLLLWISKIKSLQWLGVWGFFFVKW